MALIQSAIDTFKCKWIKKLRFSRIFISKKNFSKNTFISRFIAIVKFILTKLGKNIILWCNQDLYNYRLKLGESVKYFKYL